MREKRGTTLIELVVSIALVAIVMLFLFNLLLDVQYSTQNGEFAKDNQLNRASIVRSVMDDFANLELVGMQENATADAFELTFQFADDTTKKLTVQEKSVLYGDERWTLKSSNPNAAYQIKCIPYYFFHQPYPCETESCSDYFSVHFRIPVVISNKEENTLDDLDFYYVGKSVDISNDAFPHTNYLGFDSKMCS